MLDTPLPPGLKLIRVVPTAQRPVPHTTTFHTPVLRDPQLHNDAETRHYNLRVPSAQYKIDTLVPQRRSIDDSMIFSSIAGGFPEVSRPSTFEFNPAFPKPPSTLLSSPAYSSLKVDLSSFDHTSDPYYLEKRKQILKFCQENKSVSAVSSETSFDAKIRSINEQLLELERTPKLVEEALLAADEPTLTFSVTSVEPKQPPIATPTLPLKPPLDVSSANPASSKEDPYDKYNKNPIGNIIGKRALRIKQQLALKKAEEEGKTSESVSLEEGSASEKTAIVGNDSKEASESVESVDNAKKDDDAAEVTSSSQSEFGNCTSATDKTRESSIANQTGVADSSTDNPAVICRSASQSSSICNDVVDSTTSPDEVLEVNAIECQKDQPPRIAPVVQNSPSAIESRQTQLPPSDDTNDDSEVEVIRELPPEVTDDQLLASFLREQREAVSRKSPKASSSSKYPWERSTSPARTAASTAEEPPRKISALRRFHLDDSSITDRKAVFQRLGGTAFTSEELSMEFGDIRDRSFSSTYNPFPARSGLDSRDADYNICDDEPDSLQKRLLREAMQAEEEMRNREMAIHPARRLLTPPSSYNESVESWRNYHPPGRSGSSDYIDEELRSLEKQRDMLAAQIEKQRQLNEEKKRLEEEKKRQKIVEFKKREEVRRRLREEFEKKREQERQTLIAERKKLIQLKQKEEEERRRKLEEERREAERRERERKERERLEKLRREKAEKDLNAFVTEMIRKDMKSEFVSVKNDGTGITRTKSSSIPDVMCMCFENFQPSFERVNNLMKKRCFAKMPLNEDYVVGEWVSNFDDELMIPDIDMAILSIKEFRTQRKIENFVSILKKLPDNYIHEPNEAEYILDRDLPYYKDSDESSDEEVKLMASKIREECQKSREAQKVAREKARKAAEEAAKLEAEQKVKREAARAERERQQMERSKLLKQRKMEEMAAERNRRLSSNHDSAPLSISTVVRRDPDDPGRINYEPEKRKSSSMSQSGAQHPGPRSPDKKSSSSHFRGSGLDSPVKIKQEAHEPAALGIPIPPPSMFPPVIAPDASVVYNAAAASFAATYFPNYKFMNDFMDDNRGNSTSRLDDGPDGRPGKNKSQRSPDRIRSKHNADGFTEPSFSHTAIKPKSRPSNRSRSRSFSSSDFKPPPPRKRPRSRSSTDSFSSSDSRSPSRSTARKKRRVKTKKRHHESSKKVKKKSRKHGKEKRRTRHHGDEKSKKRKKLKKRRKPIESEPQTEDLNNEKIFINPHHQNFKAIQKKYSSSNVISPDTPEFGVIKQEPMSSESSYDSFSD